MSARALSDKHNDGSTPNLIIFGFGGHARAVADIALANGCGQLVFVDLNARAGEHFLQHPVVDRWDDTPPAGWQVFSAAGDAEARHAHIELFHARGWPLATLIAGTATIGVGAHIGEGSLVARHAHVGPMATIGAGCIINTGAVIEHECGIGEFTHASVNSVVAGRTKVGRFCMIGAGATVIDGLEIVDDVVVGAGAVVHRSIREPGVYVGNPVRKLNR